MCVSCDPRVPRTSEQAPGGGSVSPEGKLRAPGGDGPLGTGTHLSQCLSPSPGRPGRPDQLTCCVGLGVTRSHTPQTRAAPPGRGRAVGHFRFNQASSKGPRAGPGDPTEPAPRSGPGRPGACTLAPCRHAGLPLAPRDRTRPCAPRPPELCSSLLSPPSARVSHQTSHSDAENEAPEVSSETRHRPSDNPPKALGLRAPQ